MAEAFAPLSTWFAPPRAMPEPAPSGEAEAAAPQVRVRLDPLELAVLDARASYERATQRLLQLLASDVLARELAIAPVDVESLIERLWAEWSSCDPVRVRVSPANVARVAALSCIPISGDDALGDGDCIVDVRDGTIDASFRCRLELAVAAASLDPV